MPRPLSCRPPYSTLVWLSTQSFASRFPCVTLTPGIFPQIELNGRTSPPAGPVVPPPVLPSSSFQYPLIWFHIPCRNQRPDAPLARTVHTHSNPCRARSVAARHTPHSYG